MESQAKVVQQQVNEIVATADAERIVEETKTRNLRDGAVEIQEVLNRRQLRMIAIAFLTPDGRIGARTELMHAQQSRHVGARSWR